MSDSGSFQALQRRFAAHLRDPGGAPAPPGIEERRLQVYRDLFLNNVSGLLAGTFPVLAAVLGPGRWQRLARDFYREHRSHTPLFLEIPREFLDWLAEERAPQPDDPTFLGELAHYEWVELALAVDPTDLGAVPADPAGDLLAGVPVLSPLAWPLAYRYPVHRIAPGFQPLEPPAEPSFFVARRDRHDRVGFHAASAVTLRLVERLREHATLTGREQLEALADELPQFGREIVLAGGSAALNELAAADVVLGTRPA